MKCISAKQEDIDINIVLKVVYCSPPLFNDKIKGHFPMISSFLFSFTDFTYTTTHFISC